jgi:hypothetical protein
MVAAGRIAPNIAVCPLGVSPGATRFVTVALAVFSLARKSHPFKWHPASCCPDFPHLVFLKEKPKRVHFKTAAQAVLYGNQELMYLE